MVHHADLSSLWSAGQSFTWEHGSDLIRKDINRSMKQFLKDQEQNSDRRHASSEYLTVRERFTDDNRALLFVGNYYNEEIRGKVTYTHPETGETVALPYSKDEMLWPALYGILTPVCLEVSDGLKVLHSTSDILGITENEGNLEITSAEIVIWQGRSFLKVQMSKDQVRDN